MSQIFEAHVDIDYILLCEIFLNDDCAHLFELPNLIYNKTELPGTKSKGGVAIIYIRYNIQYILREDLSNFVEGEFG